MEAVPRLGLLERRTARVGGRHARAADSPLARRDAGRAALPRRALDRLDPPGRLEAHRVLRHQPGRAVRPRGRSGRVEEPGRPIAGQGQTVAGSPGRVAKARRRGDPRQLPGLRPSRPEIVEVAVGAVSRRGAGQGQVACAAWGSRAGGKCSSRRWHIVECVGNYVFYWQPGAGKRTGLGPAIVSSGQTIRER